MKKYTVKKNEDGTYRLAKKDNTTPKKDDKELDHEALVSRIAKEKDGTKE